MKVDSDKRVCPWLCRPGNQTSVCF